MSISMPILQLCSWKIEWRQEIGNTTTKNAKNFHRIVKCQLLSSIVDNQLKWARNIFREKENIQMRARVRCNLMKSHCECDCAARWLWLCMWLCDINTYEWEAFSLIRLWRSDKSKKQFPSETSEIMPLSFPLLSNKEHDVVFFIYFFFSFCRWTTHTHKQKPTSNYVKLLVSTINSAFVCDMIRQSEKSKNCLEGLIVDFSEATRLKKCYNHFPF